MTASSNSATRHKPNREVCIWTQKIGTELFTAGRFIMPQTGGEWFGWYAEGPCGTGNVLWLDVGDGYMSVLTLG